MHGTAEYKAWSAMVQRCSNTNEREFKNYGGRGIRVCEEWLEFRNFLADMGPRPAGMSIDRIDNNGNYEPTNCRWASNAQQASNKRCTRMLTIDGVTMCAAEWARHAGLSKSVIYNRLRTGWPVDRLLLDQPNHKRQKITTRMAAQS